LCGFALAIMLQAKGLVLVDVKYRKPHRFL
jgi:hypothetical protein